MHWCFSVDHDMSDAIADLMSGQPTSALSMAPVAPMYCDDEPSSSALALASPVPSVIPVCHNDEPSTSALAATLHVTSMTPVCHEDELLSTPVLDGPSTSTNAISSAKPFPFNNSSNPADVDSDILIYPSVSIEKKSGKKQDKNKDKFFVLTGDAVLAKKKQAAREKEKKEEEKMKR